MESCEYEEVNRNNAKRVKFEWRPFLRQLMICSAVWNGFFILGLGVGAPTVTIPQIRREANSTAAVSDEMASWILSLHGYAGIPVLILTPILSKYIGQKIPFLLLSISVLIGFIIFYYSSSDVHFLISKLFVGILSGFLITVGLAIVTEYTSPKYRGVFLTLKSATFGWGVWVANAVGTFCHWKVIGIIGITCAAYNLVTVVFWPESPYWLASRKRFDECAKSHYLLKGYGEDSEKELRRLINNDEMKIPPVSKSSWLSNCRKRYISDTEFSKPILLCLVMVSLYQFNGKLACMVYAIDIFKKITDSESTAYNAMLILDGVTVLGMYVGCGLSKIATRRALLITSTCIGIFFLYLIAFYLYLVKLTVIDENSYLSISLLGGFSISISIGPMIMATSLYGELLPLKLRALSMIIIGVYCNCLMSTLLKLSPYFFKTFNMHGTFFFYGFMSSICIFLLYKYLPETKDKTIQEIADCMRNKLRVTDSSKEMVCLKIKSDNISQ